MGNEKKWITNVEVRIGIGVTICLFICYFFPQIQRLAACTAVVMCTQDVQAATRKSGLIRLLGVICGGVVGIVVVLLDGVFGNDYIFFILCGIGVVLNFLLCKLVKMPGVTTRVSVITFCLVVFLLEGNLRINYAVNRFIGTLVGALIAWGLTALWQAIAFRGSKNKGSAGQE